MCMGGIYLYIYFEEGGGIYLIFSWEHAFFLV